MNLQTHRFVWRKAKAEENPSTNRHSDADWIAVPATPVDKNARLPPGILVQQTQWKPRDILKALHFNSSPFCTVFCQQHPSWQKKCIQKAHTSITSFSSVFHSGHWAWKKYPRKDYAGTHNTWLKAQTNMAILKLAPLHSDCALQWSSGVHICIAFR